MDKFVKADSRNLPKVDTAMLLQFFTENEGFSSAEVGGVKVVRSMRAEYRESAIGYVEVQRRAIDNSTVCIVKSQVCPEHRINNKNYAVKAQINETTEEISMAQCLDCAASLGCCKHVVAFLMWLNEKTIEPSPTDIVSYWKKPALSGISRDQFVTLDHFGKPDNSKIKIQFPETVLRDFLKNFDDNQTTSINIVNMTKGKPGNGSLHTLIMLFKSGDKDLDYDNFLEFLSENISSDICQQLCEGTVLQADSRLWFELRYGRITASTIYELSRARNNTTIQKRIMGASKHIITDAILRGKKLEDDVLNTLSKILRTDFQKTGFLISHENPIIGASPDGISDKFVVEIKCPASEKTVQNYITNEGKIRPKFMAQIQLQMFLFQKKKGIFCVADPQYEENEKVTFVRCKFKPKFCKRLIEKALLFWKAEIFPKLLV